MSRRFRFNSGARFACAVPAAVLLVAGVAGAQEDAAPASASVFRAISEEVQQVFQRSRDAVVKVEAADRHGRLFGTGFFIDPNGTLYTSYSIGGESDDLVVQKGNRKYPARRLIADSRSGIAILKIEAETPFLPVGRSGDLEVASPVVAIGYPMDLPVSPAFGMVSGFDLKYLGRFFATTHIRAGVPVQRGQGGAPLLDLDGNVVGILISSLDSGSGCFALPMEAAERIRSDYVRFGEVRPGWLGIDIGEVEGPGASDTARIENLIPGTPAAESGLREGDVLLRVGERSIAAPEDVLNASFFLTVGDVVPLLVSRDGEKVRVDIRVGARPGTGTSADNALQALTGPTPGRSFNLGSQ